MKLDARSWVLPGGRTVEWGQVNALRVSDALALLRDSADMLRRDPPKGLEPYDLQKTMRAFLADKSDQRDRIALHPAFDCWSNLCRLFLNGPRPLHEWQIHFPFFQSFAVALAAKRHYDLNVTVRLDGQARFFVSGLPLAFQFDKDKANKAVHVIVKRGVVSAPGGKAIPRREVVSGITVEYEDPLVRQPIENHFVGAYDDKKMNAFVTVLADAFEGLRKADPLLHAEMTDMVQVLYPLDDEKGFRSVSSSYATLRGAIGLSHSDDTLLQEETLIHEFCHQKIHALLAADKLLEPGQFGKVFYSPWRPDPRRLQGLLLGAHAFLNVARHLQISLSQNEYDQERKIAVMLNVARRIYQVDAALRAISGYATLTPFGAQFLDVMWKEVFTVYHGMQDYPSKIVTAARRQADDHRATFALFDTGLHREKAFEPGPDKIRIDGPVVKSGRGR